jgi:nucleoside-diphosphate-sugar epimerase
VEAGEFWNAEENFFWASKSFELISNTVQSNSTLVVSFGSCAEYEWPLSGIISESTNLNPITKYGQAKKKLFEDLSESKLRFLWPRIFFVYGTVSEGGKYLNYLHNSYMNNVRPIIKNPDSVIDYVSARDASEAICTLISSECAGAFNVGTGVGTTNRELALLMKDATGSIQDPIFNHGDERKVSVVADNKKLNEFFSITKFQIFRSAIKDNYKIY